MHMHFLIITALAIASFLHSLAGFGFLLFALIMYNVLNYGKSDTILATAGIALGYPSCIKTVIYISYIHLTLMFSLWLLWFYSKQI